MVFHAQMIARIHTKVRPVREMIHTLLVKIGRHHPQVRRRTLGATESHARSVIHTVKLLRPRL